MFTPDGLGVWVGMERILTPKNKIIRSYVIATLETLSDSQLESFLKNLAKNFAREEVPPVHREELAKHFIDALRHRGIAFGPNGQEPTTPQTMDALLNLNDMGEEIENHPIGGVSTDKAIVQEPTTEEIEATGEVFTEESVKDEDPEFSNFLNKLEDGSITLDETTSLKTPLEQALKNLALKIFEESKSINFPIFGLINIEVEGKHYCAWPSWSLKIHNKVSWWIGLVVEQVQLTSKCELTLKKDGGKAINGSLDFPIFALQVPKCYSFIREKTLEFSGSLLMYVMPYTPDLEGRYWIRETVPGKDDSYPLSGELKAMTLEELIKCHQKRS